MTIDERIEKLHMSGWDIAWVSNSKHFRAYRNMDIGGGVPVYIELRAGTLMRLVETIEQHWR